MEKAKRTVTCVFALAFASAAFGYGEENVSGCWAFETAPDTPCVSVTNGVVWIFGNNIWTPTLRSSTLERGICFDFGRGGKRQGFAIWQPCRMWEFESLKKRGIEASTGDVFFSSSENGHPKFGHVRRLVRAKPPDWGAIRNAAAYAGFWKSSGRRKFDISFVPKSRSDNPPTAKLGRGSPGRQSDSGAGILLKIREDGKAIFATGRTDDPYAVFPMLPSEGGYCLECRREGDGSVDLFRSSGIWIRPDGKLLLYANGEITVFERTDEWFDDPVDARKSAVANRAIHGVWGLNDDFDILILAFDRCGKGHMASLLGTIPFVWEMNASGRIICKTDVKVTFPDGSREGDEFRIECEYDIVRNEMLAELIVKTANGREKREIKKRLPFMKAEGNVE